MGSGAANLWHLLGLGLAGILLIITRKVKKKKTIREDFGVFVEKLQLLPPQPACPNASLPLTGLTFTISDVFEVEEHVTGFGHPDWGRAHDAVSPVVSTLVKGGATCIGKTVVDELAYGITRENMHYRTPTNPAAPSRTPGGSSSGAAVAVAANLADFSLGIDTVGGVRVPAGFYGIIGFRPSHGVVSHIGIVPVSTSLDTVVGWFAKDPNVLCRVGQVLLQLPHVVSCSPRQIVIADDCFQQVKIPIDRIVQVVIKSSEKLFGRQILKHENLEEYLNSKVPSLKEFHGQKKNGEVKTSTIKLLANVVQFLQRHELKYNHHKWINLVKPVLDSATSAHICGPLEASDVEIAICKSIRNELQEAVNSLLKDDGILVVPTVADPSKLGGKEILSEDFQSRAFGLLSIASLSGCCQVTVPLGFHEKCPVSVSFIAKHGGDCLLLATLQTMYASLQEQAAEIAKEKSCDGLHHILEPPKVCDTVVNLKDIERKYNELESKYFKERDELKALYRKFYDSIGEKRFGGYWLYKMRKIDVIAKQITVCDEGALKHLISINCTTVNPNGFKLDFIFASNPYFKDCVLTKTFHMTVDDPPKLEKTIGMQINWIPGCDLTKTGNGCSFFNFFKDHVEYADELEKEQDYRIGSRIRDKVIPTDCDARGYELGQPSQGVMCSRIQDKVIPTDWDVRGYDLGGPQCIIPFGFISYMFDVVQEEYFQEIADLEANYLPKYELLYDKRFKIVNGKTEENEAANVVKGVPGFWLTAMKNNEVLAKEIKKSDEDALKYLQDIRWHWVEDRTSFHLDFVFDKNPYFKNTVLTKSYDPLLRRSHGMLEIKWYPGKCLTHEVLNKHLNLAERKKKKKHLTRPCVSFFHIFYTAEVPYHIYDFDDAYEIELQKWVEYDFRIGEIIRGKIIPHAVSWFTGEALQEDDDEDDDEEDDDEDDDEEDDDEDDDKDDSEDDDEDDDDEDDDEDDNDEDDDD